MNPEINAPLASAPAPAAAPKPAAPKPAAPVPSNVTALPTNPAKVRPPRQGKKQNVFTATTKSS